MNKRIEIRAATVTALKGQTDAGPNVTNSAQVDEPGKNLPLINVFTDGEPIETLYPSREGAPSGQRRTLKLMVEIYASAKRDGGAVQDAVDAIASKVEAILNTSNLGGLVNSLNQVETEEEAKVAGQKYGSAILEFEAVYYT